MQRDELIAFFTDQRLLQQKLGDPDKFCLPSDALAVHFNELTVNQLERIDSIIKQLNSGGKFPRAEVNNYRDYYEKQETCLYTIFVRIMTVEFFHLIHIPKFPPNLHLSSPEGETASLDSDAPQIKPGSKTPSETQTTSKSVAFFRKPTRLSIANKGVASSTDRKEDPSPIQSQHPDQKTRYPKRCLARKDHKELEIKTENKSTTKNKCKIKKAIKSSGAIQAARFRNKRRALDKKSGERLPNLLLARDNLHIQIKQLTEQKKHLVREIKSRHPDVPDESGPRGAPVATSTCYTFFTKLKGAGAENPGLLQQFPPLKIL